jgi:hypothetical protein
MHRIRYIQARFHWLEYLGGSVSNVEIDRSKVLQIKAIEAIISTFETLPRQDGQARRRTDGAGRFVLQRSESLHEESFRHVP